MNSAPALHNAENRSLKSGFVAMFAAKCPLFLDHLPGRCEDPFGADLPPKIEIELPVVGLTMPQHASHSYASFRHPSEDYHARRQGESTGWSDSRLRANLGVPPFCEES
jgi:hypothetical protein